MAELPMKTVLVVEDDPELLPLVAMVLESDGYHVEMASNGLEALEVVARGQPDLILLDMKMPVMNGREFARELRARFVHRAPILVMTAAEDARKRAAEIGATGWIGKPFDIDVLCAMVKRHLAL